MNRLIVALGLLGLSATAHAEPCTFVAGGPVFGPDGSGTAFFACLRAQASDALTTALANEAAIALNEAARLVNEAAIAANAADIAALQSCPDGLVPVAGFCIQPESPYPTATYDWAGSLGVCADDGLRMCSQTELVTALHVGALRMYDFAEKDAWYVSGSQAENTPGAGGPNQVCDVQGNHDQPDHPIYSVQCNHEKEWITDWRHTVCCY